MIQRRNTNCETPPIRRRAGWREKSGMFCRRRDASHTDWNQRRVEGETVTDQERQKAEELVSRLELSVGQIFPRDGGNASLITSMIQTLNGLRSLLGIVRPH
jgi:hypothetical protein